MAPPRKRTVTSKSTTKRTTKAASARATRPNRARDADGNVLRYCAAAPAVLRQLPPGLTAEHARAIIVGASKWLNGTVLHFSFFGAGDGSPAAWAVPEAQRVIVRQAFAAWDALGIGLSFLEVQDHSEAEIRIGFDQSDGSWSYVGRDVLQQPQTDRTMNFGWDLTSDPYGLTTALHEIGHTLGMPHEHQNPFAGIVWNEDAVYAYLGAPPNNWDRQTTFNNVLRKISTAEVTGSQWDPDSIMEYDFPAGLVIEPAAYAAGIHPPGDLSPLDRQFIVTWYPDTDDGGDGGDTLTVLEPFTSKPTQLAPGQQVDYAVRPAATRSYTIATFGASDTVLGLFEKVDGDLRFVKGDDDSGLSTNAKIRHKLFQGREYVVRVRCYYSQESATTAVMYW